MIKLLDFLPLLVFFIFYKIYDIFVASALLIITTGLALAVSWVFYRKIEKMNIISFVVVTIFGTLTLVFNNTEFIKWKITVIYSLLALVLLYSQFFMVQPLIKSLLGKEIQLPETSWRRLNIAWTLFFLICGLINIYVVFRLPESSWVNFKVFGLTGLNLLFTFISGFYIWRQILQQNKIK
ncbi:septation protein A [Pantoea sp. Nvir]|uniref:septation protein A n=1 Tax=Pantoea sp. Nvir TaxID=2576760 RepID=UPI001358D201|nr:septation protein A [Pantoea sp. Nvir]MXP66694.1 septation protein A [Pantoea sp. Nvir]CAJ0991816.1 putative intracellular septation protein A [Pantoea sp. Nvir]